jgi:GT2 family glycosyltransferase
MVRTRQKNLIARFTQIEYDIKYEKMAKQQYIDHIATGSAGYRKSVFLENGGFDPRLFSVEDIDLSFRLAGKGHKMIFSSEAVVYHKHPESILAYACRKYTYGRWRVKLYRRYPEKIAIDSRTPQTQKIQIGLLFLLGMTLMGAVFSRSLLSCASALVILFLLSILPFWVKAIRKDPIVGLISPIFLLVGTIALSLGLTAGIIHLGKEILQHGRKA